MNLTEKSISKLRPGAKRRHEPDDKTTGFGVRVEPNGRKSFYWFQKVHGQPRFRALGEFPKTSLSEARAAAVKLAGDAAIWKSNGYAGPDPFAKEVRIEPATVPTFKALIDAYVERHVKETANNAERAEYDVRGMAKAHFADWTDRPIDKFTVEDMLAIKNKCGKHRVAANRCVEFIRRIFNWSGRKMDGKLNFWPVENIAASVSTYDEDPRKRFLQPDELVRFNDCLKDEKHVDLKDFLILALATGARRGDIFSSRWQDIKWEREIWTVPYPKNDESYNVQLTPAALAVLKRRRAESPDSETFVFPGPGRTKHLVDIKKPWQEFRKRAALENFHIHDLRHTHASYQSIAGVPLQQIGKSLGHRSLQSTQIYAELHDEAVRGARESGERKQQEMMRAHKKRAKLAERKPKLLKAAVSAGK